MVWYTHYSFLVFGSNRIPIVSWMHDHAAEPLTHAQQAGEMITLLGEYPSLTIGPLLGSHKHDTHGIMRESLDPKEGARSRAAPMRRTAFGDHRRMRQTDVYPEKLHVGEVEEMLYKPDYGDEQ